MLHVRISTTLRFPAPCGLWIFLCSSSPASLVARSNFFPLVVTFLRTLPVVGGPIGTFLDAPIINNVRYTCAIAAMLCDFVAFVLEFRFVCVHRSVYAGCRGRAFCLPGTKCTQDCVLHCLHGTLQNSSTSLDWVALLLHCYRPDEPPTLLACALSAPPLLMQHCVAVRGCWLRVIRPSFLPASAASAKPPRGALGLTATREHPNSRTSAHL
jgi:hypothetical protein